MNLMPLVVVILASCSAQQQPARFGGGDIVCLPNFKTKLYVIDKLYVREFRKSRWVYTLLFKTGSAKIQFNEHELGECNDRK